MDTNKLVSDVQVSKGYQVMESVYLRGVMDEGITKVCKLHTYRILKVLQDLHIPVVVDDEGKYLTTIYKSLGNQ